jgi:hypothetical protein
MKSIVRFPVHAAILICFATLPLSAEKQLSSVALQTTLTMKLALGSLYVNRRLHSC